ncbi:MAG: ComEA family DNA-binding protein, partial [Thermoleophilia bacterium]|nr:ComEA family DNA-binding protein [Thermoleophilia bacterium]
ATVVDGQQVVVPVAPSAGGGGVAVGGAEAAEPGQRVSLAAGSEADFDTLPGIGPVTAAKIVADRAKNGAFASVDDLDRVPGIGPAMVEQLRELVS